MNVADEFSWVSIHISEDDKSMYELEKTLYNNKIPCQIRENKSASGNILYSLFTTNKKKELAKVVIENALIGNLDTPIIYENPPLTPEDKVVIDHSYEVRIPKKYFWIGLVIAFFPFLLSIMSKWF